MIGRRRAAGLALVLVLPVAACGGNDDGGPISQPEATQVQETTSTDGLGGASDSTAATSPETTGALPAAATTTTTVPPTAVLASCEEPAMLIGIGDTRDEQLDAIDSPYPANARYFCFIVPEGVAEITVDLTGVTADLDLYVGFGSLASVRGLNLSDGESPEWVSNEYGVVDERVVIDAPVPGAYYIEVTPYERESSPYTLTVSG